MRACFRFCVVVLAISLFGAATRSQAPAATKASPATQEGWTQTTTTVQIIDRIAAREHDEVATLALLHPIVETYVQDVRPHGEEVTLWRDWYFLGQADMSNRLGVRPIIATKDLPPVKGPLLGVYLPVGFLQEAFVDRTGFDRLHYRFQFVGREKLGDVSCLIFDVYPLPSSGNGRFRGRIWSEDQGYTIVRFSGVFLPIYHHRNLPFPHNYEMGAHFDSWRSNVGPGLWVPSYIYDQETDISYGFRSHRGFKTQTRLWGYDLHASSPPNGFGATPTVSPILEPTSNNADNAGIQGVSRTSGETSALDTLWRAGLLAVPGDVENTLDMVLNRLESSNHLAIQPEIQCRVLTTSNLELFSIGHTIVLSRGLIDIVPDEATLATMLAQQLAEIILQKSLSVRNPSGSNSQNSAELVIRQFTARRSPQELRGASDKAAALLKNSPYSDRLGSAGLFLTQIHHKSQSLSQLIDRNLANQVYLASQIGTSDGGPQQPSSDQIAALPLGNRVQLDLRNNETQLAAPPGFEAVSTRDERPFEVKHSTPFLTRQELPAVAESVPTPETTQPSPQTHTNGLQLGINVLVPSHAAPPASDPPAYRDEGPISPHPRLGKEFWIPWITTFAMTATAIELTAHCVHQPGCVEGDPLFGKRPSRAEMYGIRGGLTALSFYLTRKKKLEGDSFAWKFGTFGALAISSLDAGWDSYQTVAYADSRHSALIANMPASQVEPVSPPSH